MANDTKNLTKRTLASLKAPSDGQRWVYDENTPGLCVCILPSDVRTWYWRRKQNGRSVRVRIGGVASTTPDNARKAAARLNGKLADGIDIQAERRETRRKASGVPSIKAAWERYRDEHLKPYRSSSSVKGDEYFFKAIPRPERRLDSLTTDDIRKLHRRMGAQRGHTMANRVVQLMRRIYNHAIEDMGYDGENPIRIRRGRNRNSNGTGGIVLFAEGERERYLLPDEAPRFFKALNAPETPKDIRDFVMILLYTGQRRRAVMAMKWADIDLKNKVWTVPATDSKNSKPVRVPLTDYAVNVLAGRERDDSGFVFPSSKSASGHMVEPKRQWQALLQRAKLTNFTLHDLRRTAGSYLAGSGASDRILIEALGHSDASTLRRYARLDTSPVRAALSTALDALHAAAAADDEAVAGRIGKAS